MGRLKIVTVTGVGPGHPIETWSRLAQKYPFVEWGILLSQQKAGGEDCKYPDLKWIADFAKAGLPTAVHLCGHFARQVAKEPLKIVHLVDVIVGPHTRIQVNVPRALRYGAEVALRPLTDRQFIIQTNTFDGFYGRTDTSPHINPLHDLSGGVGRVTPDFDYQHVPKGAFAGFAGGFSGENIAERLRLVAEVAEREGFDYWVDAEGALRTTAMSATDQPNVTKMDNILDPDAVEAYLVAASAFL